MVDWSMMQHDIEDFRRRVAKTSSGPFSELWDVYAEGLWLHEELDSFLYEVQTPEALVGINAWIRAQHALEEEILRRAHTVGEELHAWLRQRLGECQKRVIEISADTRIPSLLVVARLQSMANDLLFLRILAATLEDRSHDGGLPDVLSEIYHFVVNRDKWRYFLTNPSLTDKLDHLRRQAVAKELEAFNQEIPKILAQPQAEKIWETLRWGSHLKVNLIAGDHLQQQLKTQYEAQKDVLRSQWQHALGDLPGEEHHRLLAEALQEVLDRVDEILVNAEEVDLDVAIRMLVGIKDEVLWIKSILEKEKGEFPPSLAQRAQKLQRARKRLAAEIQEKKLQHRLEGIFGRRFVVFFEDSILLLIFAVTILLIYEGTLPENSPQLIPLMWVDTAICVVFLVEFFTKWLLAEKHWLYFRRNWFIGLLPSIPFGLLEYTLHQIHLLDHAHLGQWGRFLSFLPRIIRFVRFLRPIVRIFRVVSLLLRGFDRLVRRYGKWLNHNIVFFASAEEKLPYDEQSLVPKIQGLRAVCLHRARAILANQRNQVGEFYLHVRLEYLHARLEASDAVRPTEKMAVTDREIRVEELVQTLLTIKGTQVEEMIGQDFPYRLHNYLGYLNAPLVRLLPGIRQLVQKQKTMGPPEFTAWILRSWGRLLEWLLALVNSLADLAGMVSGTRLLDRLANTLISSFARPAKRLLFIGGFFIAITMLVNTLNLPLLHDILEVLDRFVGIPMAIIGSVCLIPLCLGFWLRNVAGEATDFYETVTEAQFISLLKELKSRNLLEDLKLLYDRFLCAECLLTMEEVSPSTGQSIVRQLQEQLTGWDMRPLENPRLTTRLEARRWSRLHQVVLLYKDYLDGAPLHRSDVKTTEQLLGNMDLQNIRCHRLGYRRREMRLLEKLDLTHAKAILGGPYLWFTFLTQSVVQSTAKLILEYNKHCIAEDNLAAQIDPERIARYHAWLDDQGKQNPSRPSPQKRRPGVIDHPLYSTTQFTALHFLACDPNQDEAIRLRFDPRLYHKFLRDRRQMIREIFGTYPLHHLPRSERMINPYHLYHEYIGNGRIFFLPWRLLVMLLHLTRLALGWLYQQLREIFNPSLALEEQGKWETDFAVAIRKINRIRKPIFMNALKLRSEFDFEYLGLCLPWVAVSGLEGQTFEEDLEFIGALDRERDYFTTLRHERKEQLRAFAAFLQHRGWDGDGFKDYIHTIDPDRVIVHREILRALAIAYTIDFQKLRTLLQARERIEKTFQRSLERRGRIPEYRWKSRFYQLGRRLLVTLCFICQDPEKIAFTRYWEQAGRSLTRRELRWCWRAYLADRKLLKESLFLISGHEEHYPMRLAEEIIQSIIRYSSPWTEELLALRTVQTLSVMDVRNYRRHIYCLGQYQEYP